MAVIDKSAVRMVCAGFRSLLSMPWRIVPVLEETFGCQISVSNLISGGLSG